MNRMRRLARRAGIAFCALTLLATVGCVVSGPPADAPSIRGTISQLDVTAGGRGSMLVEGQVESDTQYDRASITINNSTLFYDAEARSTGPDSLALGQNVEVWFEGPVAESYPVQATAGAVKITQ